MQPCRHSVNSERTCVKRWITALGYVVAVSVFGLGFLVAAKVTAIQKRSITWKHLSSKNGELPAPNVGRQCCSLILDVDRDGVNDFVVGGWGETQGQVKIEWYRRKADGWTKYLVDPDVKYVEAGGDAADIDGDGDPDFAMGGDWRTAKEVWWWENPYPNFEPNTPWRRRHIKNSDEGGKSHHDLILGDFDGDGRIEAVFWNQNAGKLFLAKTPPDPRSAASWPLTVIYQFALPPRDKYEGLAKADIDLDGKPDIVGAGVWFKHQGGANFTMNPIDPAFYASRSAVGDLKKGGRPEVVLSPGDIAGPLNWYEWNGQAWIKHPLLPEVDHGHSLQVADLNGDGNLDIFCAEMAVWGNGKNPDSKTWIFLWGRQGQF